MTVEIKVPALGESVAEATIAKWHKAVGDKVEMDELLVELETDKITLEVNSLASGVLIGLSQPQGATVKVGDVIGLIEAGAITSPELSDKPESVVASKSLGATASPAARKIAADNNLNVEKIEGSGRRGMVMKEDVLSAATEIKIMMPTTPNKIISERTNRVKMTRLRKTIAQRLKDSQNTAAILTTFNEVDLSEVIRLRKTHQELFQAKHNVKIGFMSFFVKAVVAALKFVPSVNAEIDGDEIVYKHFYDIGVAVGTEQGLVVPVVRDVDHKSFADIEKEIAELGKKARDGKLTMQDLQGGTFSVTNGGIYGSLLSTPIINPPQSAILGMHNIVERPVAVDGKVEIRPIMYLALSYDHRLIDGKEAVTFLVKVKDLIEKPEKILLDL